MTEVYRRKLALDKYTPTLTAVTLFYSRIILKKLTSENKTTFRKLEKSVKFSINVQVGLNMHLYVDIGDASSSLWGSISSSLCVFCFIGP